MFPHPIRATPIGSTVVILAFLPRCYSLAAIQSRQDHPLATYPFIRSHCVPIPPCRHASLCRRVTQLPAASAVSASREPLPPAVSAPPRDHPSRDVSRACSNPDSHLPSDVQSPCPSQWLHR